MSAIFGIPSSALFGQILLGLINGSFYALLSLGLAVIFGMLNIINFTHGAQYMMGAFVAWMLLKYAGVGYWWSLLIAPVVVGISGIVLERLFLARLYKLNHLYGLLLTFGMSLIIEGLFRNEYGVSGLAYAIPAALRGGNDLGFMVLPNYRGWVVAISLVVCLSTWLVIEKTKLGSYLRAATENPALVRAFGVNVSRLITLTYGLGVALAAFAGVLAAPIYSVSPNMGADLMSVVFAIVVIGGMGSILGSIIIGFGLGVAESLTKVFYPEFSATVIFVIMVLVLMLKPAGLFGRQATVSDAQASMAPTGSIKHDRNDVGLHRNIFIGIGLALIAAPIVLYPVFLMKVLCFALFACAFNLLLGFGGLMSFGHAAYFGAASYISAYAIKSWGMPPEIAIVLGTLSGAALGVVFGVIAIRRQGIYFSMITMALAQLIFFISLQAPFTGGEDGIQSVPRGHLFGFLDLKNDMTLYFVVVVIFMAGLLFVYRIIHSPFGQVIKAIRDNEPRAISLGYRVNEYKICLFVLSTAIAGLAGATKAVVFQLASLTDVHWAMSGEPVLMTLVGGLGTIFGPLMGATIIIAMQDYLATLGAWVFVAQGIVFVICVMLFRDGIIGVLARWTKRRL
jgi:branched-chain amino acid transport system permease protein